MSGPGAEPCRLQPRCPKKQRRSRNGTLSDPVSSFVPDWSREVPRCCWDPSRRLLRSLRAHEEPATPLSQRCCCPQHLPLASPLPLHGRLRRRQAIDVTPCATGSLLLPWIALGDRRLGDRTCGEQRCCRHCAIDVNLPRQRQARGRQAQAEFSRHPSRPPAPAPQSLSPQSSAPAAPALPGCASARPRRSAIPGIPWTAPRG